MSTTSEPNVAVVGATGAVGNEIVELIAARGFPHSRLTLFASQSGAAGTLETAQDEYLVEALRDAEDLAAFDVAFLAVPESVAADITRAAKQHLNTANRVVLVTNPAPGATRGQTRRNR